MLPPMSGVEKNRNLSFFPPESVITLLAPGKDLNSGSFPPQSLGVTWVSFEKKSIFDDFFDDFCRVRSTLGKLTKTSFYKSDKSADFQRRIPSLEVIERW